ncbi:SIMPL domain-containing protein [Terrabacter carboxydivorans]|uniref:SIMPL domain-containing protein n=1 Tax=Terrabacter carboxydivorans TaxID=619730 RepID=A0ABN3LS13_9MICO
MGKRTVTVTGTGRAAVSPDVVRLDLRVGHDAADVAAALAGAAAGITRIGSVIREHDVADADIRTLDAAVNQRWDNTGTAVGFTAQQRLAVTVRRLEAVGEILEAAAAAVGKALLVDQVRLDVSDRSDGLRRARDAAFADARDKAEQYAVLSGAQLGAVLGVAETGAVPLSGPREMKLMAVAAGAGGMPVEGGDLDLGASVTVRWELA